MCIEYLAARHLPAGQRSFGTAVRQHGHWLFALLPRQRLRGRVARFASVQHRCRT